MKQRSVLVESISTEAISNTSTVVYRVPPNTRAKWVLAFVANSTNSTISNVDLKIYNGVSIFVLAAKSLGSGEFLQFDSSSGYVMLEEGYEIRARAGAAGVSCILTLEETIGLVKTA